MRKLLLLPIILFISCNENVIEPQVSNLIIEGIIKIDEDYSEYHIMARFKDYHHNSWIYLKDSINKYKIGDTLILIKK